MFIVTRLISKTKLVESNVALCTFVKLFLVENNWNLLYLPYQWSSYLWRDVCCKIFCIGNSRELLQCFSFSRLKSTILGILKYVILGKLQYFSFQEIEMCCSPEIKMCHFRGIEMRYFWEIKISHFWDI